jgi:ubiquitin C-terminal hydrolase
MTPWTGDQPVARPLLTHRTTQTQNKRTQTSISQVEFEPTITAFERVKTVHASDLASTMIGSYCHMLANSSFIYRPTIRSYKVLILTASLNNPQKVNSALITTTSANGDRNISETSGINSTLIWLIARKDFNMYCRRESFKSDVKIMNSLIFHRSWEAKSRLPHRAVIFIRSITW